MRTLYILLICLLAVGTVQAQQKIPKEEKARRDKNVEAANPFAKYGSKAKVATLSKGKYLEVQDLDSIVVIGSVKFNVNTNKIVDYVERDSLSNDTQPVGDMPSRWMSPDPLSEEFSSWSPYSFSFNSPIIFKDPDGQAALKVDFEPTKEGHLKVEKGDNAQKLYKQYGVAVKDKNFQFKEGNIITLDNNVTRAIGRSRGGSIEELNSGKAKFDVKNDNYICDECAQMANAGEEITPSNAQKYNQFPDPMSMDSTPGYSEVKSFEGVSLGQGIASIGGQHTVSYYGTSNDGTVYVTTKNGREAKPEVMPLTQVIGDFNKNQNTNFSTKDVRYFKKDTPK